MPKTLADKEINKVHAKHHKDLEELERKISILNQLPATDFDAPVITSLKDESIPGDYSGCGWISYSAPSYDPDKKWDPIALVTALQDLGWRLAPSCLIKQGNYRTRITHGAPGELPKTISGDPIHYATPVLPVWVVPQQHTQCDVAAWLRSPDGRVFKFTVDVPGLASISAHRTGRAGGDWGFVRGTGKVHATRLHTQWTNLRWPIGKAKCWVDTDQGISGRVYWKLSSPNPELPELAKAFIAIIA